MKNETRDALKVIVTALAGAVVGIMLALLIPITRGRHGNPGIYYPINMALSMASIFLLISILRIYVNDYKQIKARFTLGLIVFLSALLLQTIFSLPVLHSLFGFSAAGLGPFSVIMNALEMFAIAVFLYLSGGE